MSNNPTFFHDGRPRHARDRDVNDYLSSKPRCPRPASSVSVRCLMVVCEIASKGLPGLSFLEAKGPKGGGGGDKPSDICYQNFLNSGFHGDGAFLAARNPQNSPGISAVRNGTRA